MYTCWIEITQGNVSRSLNVHIFFKASTGIELIRQGDYHSALTYLKQRVILRRVSFETSFDSKQPKLEPKPVSALSETKPLFRLFRFYTETESFDVSIEPKQTEVQQKQFDREHILLFFTGNVGFFLFFRFFRFFPRFFSPKQFKREYIWVFFRKCRVVSVCFGLLRNSFVCFDCFDIGSKHRN
jgi:hypothetical protein